MENNKKLLDRLLDLSDSVTETETALLHFVEKLQQGEKTEDSSSSADMKHLHWIPLKQTVVKKFQKNSKVSVALRNNGNAAYKKKQFVCAVKSYNLAIAFAEGPDLALAYGNRAAVLSCLDLPEQALIDIDLAILKGEPYNVPLLKNWRDRKEKYEAEINGRISNHFFEIQLEDQVSQRNIFYKEMFTLKSPNPLAPALEDSVTVEWNPKRGRHIVATRDIPLGSTVLVEDPFAAILGGFRNWEVDYCHHCLKRSLVLVPCPNCVLTLYCNDNCRTEAQKYHQYECPCLPDLYCLLGTFENNRMLYFLLAFKLACLMGPHKLFDIFTQRKHSNQDSVKDENHGNIRGSDPDTGIYSSDSYDALFHLTTLEIPKSDFSCVAVSQVLSDVLMSSSNFFDFLTSEVEKTEFRKFMSEFLYHHFRTFEKNVFTISGDSSMDGLTLRTHLKSRENPKPIEKLAQGEDSPITAAYATASLFNHSCSPNVVKFYGKKFGTMAVVTVKSVKKGQELLISDGPKYSDSDEERQVTLYNSYQFKCDCIACKYDWPSLELMRWEQPVFCCPLCSAKSDKIKMSPEILDFQLSQRENFQCKVCKAQYSEQVLLQDYHRSCQKLKFSQDFLNRDTPFVSLRVIKSALSFFENTLVRLAPDCYTYNSLGITCFTSTVDCIIFFSDID